MTEKHTKGPLQVLITDGATMKGANCVLISENGDQITRCSAPFPFDTSWDERDANAHRLALTWNFHDELLAALQAVMAKCACLEFGDRSAFIAAEAVIAKATRGLP